MLPTKIAPTPRTINKNKSELAGLSFQGNDSWKISAISMGLQSAIRITKQLLFQRTRTLQSKSKQDSSFKAWNFITIEFNANMEILIKWKLNWQSARFYGVVVTDGSLRFVNRWKTDQFVWKRRMFIGDLNGWLILHQLHFYGKWWNKNVFIFEDTSYKMQWQFRFILLPVYWGMMSASDSWQRAIFQSSFFFRWNFQRLQV